MSHIDVVVSFDVTPTDSECPLGMTVWLDDVAVATHTHVDRTCSVTVKFADSMQTQTHRLRIEMSGKQSEHTKLDAQGNFLQDPRLIISDFRVSEIPADAILHSQATYQHNHNGNGELETHQFSGVMGCNGTVDLEITTPVLMWLLEHS
jgi:metal-sulfur cluster biosynthetic enzyme